MASSEIRSNMKNAQECQKSPSAKNENLFDVKIRKGAIYAGSAGNLSGVCVQPVCRLLEKKKKLHRGGKRSNLFNTNAMMAKFRKIATEREAEFLKRRLNDQPPRHMNTIDALLLFSFAERQQRIPSSTEMELGMLGAHDGKQLRVAEEFCSHEAAAAALWERRTVSLETARRIARRVCEETARGGRGKAVLKTDVFDDKPKEERTDRKTSSPRALSVDSDSESLSSRTPWKKRKNDSTEIRNGPAESKAQSSSPDVRAQLEHHPTSTPNQTPFVPFDAGTSVSRRVVTKNSVCSRSEESRTAVKTAEVNRVGIQEDGTETQGGEAPISLEPETLRRLVPYEVDEDDSLAGDRPPSPPPSSPRRSGDVDADVCSPINACWVRESLPKLKRTKSQGISVEELLTTTRRKIEELGEPNNDTATQTPQVEGPPREVNAEPNREEIQKKSIENTVGDNEKTADNTHRQPANLSFGENSSDDSFDRLIVDEDYTDTATAEPTQVRENLGTNEQRHHSSADVLQASQAKLDIETGGTVVHTGAVSTDRVPGDGLGRECAGRTSEGTCTEKDESKGARLEAQEVTSAQTAEKSSAVSAREPNNSPNVECDKLSSSATSKIHLAKNGAPEERTVKKSHGLSIDADKRNEAAEHNSKEKRTKSCRRRQTDATPKSTRPRSKAASTSRKVQNETPLDINSRPQDEISSYVRMILKKNVRNMSYEAGSTQFPHCEDVGFFSDSPGSPDLTPLSQTGQIILENLRNLDKMTDDDVLKMTTRSSVQQKKKPDQSANIQSKTNEILTSDHLAQTASVDLARQQPSWNFRSHQGPAQGYGYALTCTPGYPGFWRPTAAVGVAQPFPWALYPPPSGAPVVPPHCPFVVPSSFIDPMMGTSLYPGGQSGHSSMTRPYGLPSSPMSTFTRTSGRRIPLPPAYPWYQTVLAPPPPPPPPPPPVRVPPQQTSVGSGVSKQ